jgi:hypothetical protein
MTKVHLYSTFISGLHHPWKCWLLHSASLSDCRGIGACCVGALILCSSSPSVLGSRISCSLQSLSTVMSRSCRGTPVVSVYPSLPMAATIWSSGVTDGLIRHLCLNHTTPDTRGTCVSFIQTCWHWWCPNNMPMTYPFLQCCA